MSELVDVSSKPVQLKRITNGGLVAKPLSDVLQFVGKTSITSIKKILGQKPSVSSELYISIGWPGPAPSWPRL